MLSKKTWLNAWAALCEHPLNEEERRYAELKHRSTEVRTTLRELHRLTRVKIRNEPHHHDNPEDTVEWKVVGNHEPLIVTTTANTIQVVTTSGDTPAGLHLSWNDEGHHIKAIGYPGDWLQWVRHHMGTEDQP